MKTLRPFRSHRAARAAFEILVREHRDGVLAYARSLVDDPGSAEDIAQEAFLVAWRKLDQFNPEMDFGAWIRGMVRFEYLHLMRKRKLVPLEEETLDQLEQFQSGLAEAAESRQQIFDAVRQCVASLPEGLRRTVESVYGHGFTCPELARQEEASESAIRKRLQRGRDLVASCLDGKEGILSLKLRNPDHA